jgi:hypothetical protein
MERVFVVWVSENVKITTISSNEIVRISVQRERIKRIELMVQVRQRLWQQFFTLLIKSGVGNSVGVIVEVFEEFVRGVVAFLGNKEPQEVFKIEFPIPSEIGIGIFSEFPRCFSHLMNCAP